MATEELVAVELNRLRGRLCGLIESWGLPHRQERAAKQLVKSLSYDSEERILEAITQPTAVE